MKRRKILALLTVGALLAGTLSGCGGDNGASGDAGSAGSTGEAAGESEAVEMILRPLPLSITMRTVRMTAGAIHR